MYSTLKISLLLGSLLAQANAATMNFYWDTDCQDFARSDSSPSSPGCIDLFQEYGSVILDCNSDDTQCQAWIFYAQDDCPPDVEAQSLTGQSCPCHSQGDQGEFGECFNISPERLGASPFSIRVQPDTEPPGQDPPGP